MAVPQKLNIDLPHDPAIPLLGIFPKNRKQGLKTDICTPTSTAAVFTIAKRQKQPKCLSTDEWINKIWYINTRKHYSALKRKEIPTHAKTWKNLEDTVLNEISHKRTNII